MPFNISRAGSISLEGGMQALQALDRSALVDRLRLTLGVGSVLDVTVAPEREGQQGILIQGHYFKAQLPDGQKSGEKLTVVVTENRDAVVLKVLNETETGEAPRIFKPNVASAQLLQNLLPPESIALLKKLRLPLDGAELSPQKAVEQGVLSKLIDQLLETGVLLSASTLNNPEKLREVLQNFSQKLGRFQNHKHNIELSQLLPKINSEEMGNTSAEELRAFAQSLKEHFDNIIEGQGLLNGFNPIMQSLGEPALIMIPAFLNGLFSKWEISSFPEVKQLSKEKNNEAKEESDEYRKLKLFVQLPALGGIQIEMAHRKNEILLGLVVESQPLADFIHSRMGQLKEIFTKLGYQNSMINARQGDPHSVSPEWFHEVTRKSIVA